MQSAKKPYAGGRPKPAGSHKKRSKAGRVRDGITGETRVAASDLAEALGVSKRSLALSVGLPSTAVSRTSRETARKTQERLRELQELLKLLSPLAGGIHQAYAYYRSQPIPELGGRTAEAMLKSGKSHVVRDFVDHVRMGGFA